MKSLNRILLPVLLSICCVLFGLAFLWTMPKAAMADGTEKSDTLQVEGASIRYASGDNDDQGIRFVVNASVASFDELILSNENVAVNVIIISLPNLKNAGLTAETLEKDSDVYFMHTINIYQKVGGKVISNVWSVDSNDDSLYTANVYIWGIPISQYNLYWVAKMYYETDDGVVYSINTVTNSMSEVALKNYEQATDEQKAELDNFLKNYTVTWYNTDGVSVLKTDNNQTYGSKFSAPTVDMDGYDSIWYKRTGTDVNNNPIWSSSAYDLTDANSLVRGDTQLKLGKKAIDYTITYNGLRNAPGGAETTSNPTSYNVETATITLSNPTEENNKFLGWTYEGQTTPIKNPTIPVGSTGNKTFTANWADFEVEDDFVYMGYYGLIEPTSLSGYGVESSDVIYTSGNTSVATADGHKIISVTTGTATITANLGNLEKTFTVTVKATSAGDNAPKSERTMETDAGTYGRHTNNKKSLEMFNYSGDLTLFMGDSFMDERWFFTDFYTSRYTTSNAYLLGISSSRASHWRFFVQDYLAYAPKNIVVLHIGTNDLFDGSQSTDNVIKYVKNVLDVIHEGSPSTTVYYWTIEDRYTISGWTKNQASDITAINSAITEYASDNSSWLKVVNTRSLLTATADYREADGTVRVHPSVPTGYNKCISATVSAGLSITTNTKAKTYIVKDWTSVNGTDNFGTAKFLGPQARMNNFLWESKVTIKNFENTGAKGHISIQWRKANADGDGWTGENNRFVILNKDGDGKFYFTGKTPTFNAWSNSTPDYIKATSGVNKTFKLAILATEKNAYMFLDDVLVAVIMNISYTATNAGDGGTWPSFRVGGELATVEFKNNKIANTNLNSSLYNSYLGDEGVLNCEENTSITEKTILFREATFNVYNNNNFTANDVDVIFTDTSTGYNYNGVIENNKLIIETDFAGEMLGTYNLTADISGITATVYSNAQISVSNGVYTIDGSPTIYFDNIFMAGAGVRTQTDAGQAYVDLANGVYNKTSGSVFMNAALKVNLTSSFYAAVYMKGNISQISAETRFGIHAGQNNTKGVTFLKTANNTTFSVQNMNDGWATYCSGLNFADLNTNGYWLILHQNLSTGTRTVYISDPNCNYLLCVSKTVTNDIYKNAITTIGVGMWDTAFTMTASNFRIGSTLQAALNKTVNITVTNSNNCVVDVPSSAMAGSVVTFSVTPNKGYQVSYITMNGLDITDTLNKSAFTFIALKDTTFTPAISTIALRINLGNATITEQNNFNSNVAYNSRIGLSNFIWQGFMGFPSDTTLDLSASGEWQVSAMFYTEGGSSDSFQIQLLRWGGTVYIKVYKDGSNSNASSISLSGNSDIMTKLIADKGLNVRLTFNGDSISTYVLGGNDYDNWYQIHNNYSILNEGTFVNKIIYYKNLSSISSLNAVVNNASIITYVSEPRVVAVDDGINSSSGVVSERQIATVAAYDEDIFTWSGFVGFNVKDGSSSVLWTTNTMWFSDVKFKDANGSTVLEFQLLEWSGNHYAKLLGSGLGNNTMSYPFYTSGASYSGNLYETYLRNNGGLYVSVAYDSTNKTASMWIMNSNNQLTQVYADIALPTCSGNKIASINWYTLDDGTSLTDYISGSFVKQQTLKFTENIDGEDIYQFKTSALASYKIIYDADYAELATIANTLKNNISSKYGVSLTVGSDTAVSESAYEILIGDTNRYSDSGKLMKYSVSVDGRKLKINVGGVFSAQKAIEYLNSSVFTGNSFTLNSGEYYSTSLITTTQAITSGSTARVMSANMLADAFNSDSNYATAAYRAEIFVGVLLAYTPDVLGVQETDAAWNNVLDKYLNKVNSEKGYNYARALTHYDNKINYTSLIYRADKYNINASGVKVFTWWNDKAFNHGFHMRNISWAQFTSKTDSSKKFVLANTHWSYRTEHVGSYLYGSSTPIATEELRYQCRDETKEYLTTLKNNYNMPIFLTGDFNTSLPYFTSYGWLNSSYKVVSQQASDAGTLITTVPTSGHFDHIMGTGTYQVKRFDLLNNVNYRNLVSDHSFVYADVAF